MSFLNTRSILQSGKKDILIVGLSMAIGWGIRGNFGHQYGAAFAGCLAAIAMCLLSGREDWRNKVLYFGFFGAIGWGFGATISYMQVISYTESGQAATQWFGYISLFIIGFLWAALGAAATALVAAADPDQLTRLFKVVLWVFVAWLVQDLTEDYIARLLEPAAAFDSTASRQKNPLYWFDANYLPPCFALMAIGLYDLVDRKEKNLLFLPLFCIAGAFAGWLIQSGLGIIGWEHTLSELLTFRLGDLSYTDPSTGAPAYKAGDLLINWPQWFSDYPHAVGWFTGLLTSIAVYFKRFGKFRNGSSLIVYMAGGWLVFFLVFPVLGSLLFTHFGGIRMTPPRSDDWAGMAGVFAGTIVWLKRNNYLPVATASVVSGAIGGLGFAGIQWVKQMMMAPGNPRIAMAKGMMPGSSQYENIVSSWANWQHQNWHSFLEQSYGFINGIALAVGMGLLAKRLPLVTNYKATAAELNFKKWMAGICTIFILLIVPYVNLIKNVDIWSSFLKPEIWMRVISSATGAKETAPALWDVPYVGRLPGIQSLSLTPEGWFNFTWLLLLVAFIALIRKHFKQPLPLVPKTWTGRGQLIFLLLLWIMVVGNFEREIFQWTPERLLTEWVITVDAIIVTYYILVLPQQSVRQSVAGSAGSFRSSYKRAWIGTVAAMFIFATFFLLTNRLVYHYDPNEILDTKRYHLRFGPQADWRARPILKTAEHK